MFVSCEEGLHKAHARRAPCVKFARVKRLQSRRQFCACAPVVRFGNFIGEPYEIVLLQCCRTFSRRVATEHRRVSLAPCWLLGALRPPEPFHMSNVLGKPLCLRIACAMEGWERFVVACSFLVSIASPLNWFYTPKLRCQLLYELDATRRDRYHGHHMRIVHAWLRVALHACRERFWARFWRVYERHSS